MLFIYYVEWRVIDYLVREGVLFMFVVFWSLVFEEFFFKILLLDFGINERFWVVCDFVIFRMLILFKFGLCIEYEVVGVWWNVILRCFL